MKRGAPMRRTPMRRTRSRPAPTVERCWGEALAKVARERVCRLHDAWVTGAAACQGPVQAAHVIGRAKADEPHPDGSGRLMVREVDVVPLCQEHHLSYDQRRLDLLPYLSAEEQTRAVQVAGGILSALARISGKAAAHG